MGFSSQEHRSGLLFPSPMHESEREFTQSCLTLSDPMDCSPPGSSVHGIFQARALEWGAIAFSPGAANGKQSACQCSRQETRVQSLGEKDPLEEGMAIHSSILAWRIQWTEEPGGLQSIGSYRVRHN